MAKSRPARRTQTSAAARPARGVRARRTAAPAPPLPAPGTETAQTSGVDAFAGAMTALQRRDYRTARHAFLGLLDAFPSEGALLDRARVYLALCERELQRSASATPQTLEERLTAATAALNNDQEGLAEQLLVSIVDEAPRHELGHYLTAVLHARRGDFADALSALQRAIRISPEVLAQARHDEDFDNLRADPAFDRLLTS